MSSGRLFRIAELARKTGTPKETIHYYLRIGLLMKPKKTSRNMAYYDESHVEQLKLITRLRNESYLPLEVIKRILKEGKAAESARRMDLAGDLFGQGAKAELEVLTRAGLAKKTGASEKKIADFEAAGLLLPVTDACGKRYTLEDLRVVEIMAAAEEEAGPGAESFLIERFQLLERHVTELVREESAQFFASLFATSEPQIAWNLLRGGRETIGRYLAIARVRRLRHEIEGLLREVETALERFHARPLPKRSWRAPDEPVAMAELVRAHEERQNDPEKAQALLAHLVAQGDDEELIARFESLKPKLKREPAIRQLAAEAYLERDRHDDAIALLESLLEEGAEIAAGSAGERDQNLDLLIAASVLGRLRDRLTTSASARRGGGVAPTSSVEVIHDLVRGLSHLHRARRTPPAGDPLVALRMRLLLGRMETAMPGFLGRRESGRNELRGCLEDITRLRGGEHDPGLGVLDRLEFNTARALASHTKDPKEREVMEAKLQAFEAGVGV